MTDSAVVEGFAVEAAAVAVVDGGEQCSGFVAGMLPVPLLSCCWQEIEYLLKLGLVADLIGFLKIPI